MKPRKKTNSFALALRLRARAAMLLIALLCGVTGAWADNLYLEVSDKSATLKYGDKGDNPYYDYSSGSVTMYWSGANDAKTSVTTINVHTTCASHGETNLENLFKDFTALTTINGLGNLKTTGVTNMAFMFNNCPELVTLDLSSWNTASVTNMSSMFNSCSKLANIYVGSGWSVENVTEDKGSNMFLNCTSLPGYTSSETGKSKAHTGEGGYLKTKSTTAVDLGLPSGTKWANMNVGATTETGIGTYFAWGGTASQANYSEANAPYYVSSNNYSKYNGTDNKTTLDLTDDAAYANWGSQWRMPTKAEIDELQNTTYTTWTWEENYNSTGVNGYLVTGKGDYSGNSIFLPASGNMNGTEMRYKDEIGHYNSSTINSSKTSNAYSLQFNNSLIETNNFGRQLGFSVRPVQMFAGEGTEGSPYLIASTTDWNNLVSAVNGGETYSGKYFKMTANVGTVTTTLGTSTTYLFNGTFDGDGHTLTVNISNSNADPRTAPFAWAGGSAVIKNLHVAGSLTNTARTAGIVGSCYATTQITNCRVSATVSGGNHTSGISISGGQITGCLFDGNINGTASTAGFATYPASGTKITNCLFKPQDGSSIPSSQGCFYASEGTAPTLTNCYYTSTAGGTAQGKQARSISKGTGVSELYNSGTPYIYYNVSGITAYTTGIKYAEVYYAGEGDAVSLTLGHEAASDGYAFGRYATTGGTITAQTETSASLTMPAANVTISAVYDPLYNATFVTGNDNSGWTISPMQQTEGGTVTVSYEGENKVKSVTVAPKGALTGKFSVSSTK